MTTRRLIGFATLSMVLVLAACKGTDEKAAMQAYMKKAQEIAQSLGQSGEKLDTLMNVHANAPQWSAAEKTELKAARDTMKGLLDDAKALTAPPLVADIHPLLIQGITELVETMDGVTTVTENPTAATPDMVKMLQSKPQQAQEHLNEYLQKLENALRDKYPDLLKE